MNYGANLAIFCILWCGIIGESKQKFTEWAAGVPGGYEDARKVATQHGLTLRGHVQVGSKNDKVFRFSANNVSDEESVIISQLLSDHPKVKWVSLQGELSRERKTVIRGFSTEWNRQDSNKVLSRQKRHHDDVNCLCKNVSNFPHESFGSHVHEVLNRQSDPSLAHMFNDPKWPCQWELYNCGQTTGPHRVDLNVVPCWEKGFTGKGVVVSVVDDGLDYVNEDLNKSFDLRASTDLNENHDMDGPLPNKKTVDNDHGTKCGGEIAMQPNNNYCGVGVAYDAKLGGIRFLDGVVTDTSEAAALVFNADYIDIYSCSWGPQDDGRTWEGPGKLASAALEVGSSEGRGGLGSVYVWAAGNGGAANDHCGADGYTCSIYTIGIASVSDQGMSTFYTEPCPCIMAVTLNGGPHHMPQSINRYKPMHYLVTTDPYEGCVNTFSGTSSAAPLASGVVALMLQANPKLTWRDVQHIIVENSKIPNPTEVGWNVNGAGFHVHQKYGFGLMDAAKLVMAAQSWENVDKQQRCEVVFPPLKKYVSSGGTETFSGHTNACSNSENRVQRLEHVQVVMTYFVKCRGDVSIEVISPCGTRSELMGTRSLDDSNVPIRNWAFMTVHTWGEDPRGVWKIKVNDNKGTVQNCYRSDDEPSGVYVQDIKIIFWGTRGKKWKKPSCVRKQQIAASVMRENNEQTEEPIILDPKNPLKANDRLDQEIIIGEFIGEQDDPITVNDLSDPQVGPQEKPIEVDGGKSKQYDQDVQKFRRWLFGYLRKNQEYDEENESLRDDIPLNRSTRKKGE